MGSLVKIVILPDIELKDMPGNIIQNIYEKLPYNSAKDFHKVIKKSGYKYVPNRIKHSDFKYYYEIRGNVQNFTLSPDGNYIAIYSIINRSIPTIFIIDIETSNIIYTINPKIPTILTNSNVNIKYNPDSSIFAIITNDTIHFYNNNYKFIRKIIVRFKIHDFCYYNNSFIVLLNNNQINIYNNYELVNNMIIDDSDTLTNIAYNAEYNNILIGGNKSIYSLNIDSLTANKIITTDYIIKNIIYNPNGTNFTMIDNIGNVYIYNIFDFSLRHKFKFDTYIRTPSQFNIIYSPDGTNLAISLNNTVKIWNIDELDFIDIIRFNASIKKILYSSSGASLLTICNDNKLYLWNTGLDINTHSDKTAKLWNDIIYGGNYDLSSSSKS